MGLVSNLLISVIDLVFVVTDVLLIMILIRATYNLWRFEWLRPLNHAVQPVMSRITGHLGTCVAKVTGKVYPEKTLLIVFIVGMTFLRFLTAGLFANR